jgi:hypothetical protein
MHGKLMRNKLHGSLPTFTFLAIDFQSTYRILTPPFFNSEAQFFEEAQKGSGRRYPAD